MRSRPWMNDRVGQVATLTAALLVLAVCFCVFGHDEEPNLCAGMLVSSLALVLLGAALANGQLLIDPSRSVYAVSLHIPDPPPKFRSLA